MIDSLKKNKKGIILMIFSSVLVCFGQLMWKLSSRGLQYLIIGFILYGVGALIMLIAYKYGSLSVLQPCLSLNYALSIFLGVWVLGESLSIMKIIGIIIIIIGVIMIGGGDE